MHCDDPDPDERDIILDLNFVEHLKLRTGDYTERWYITEQAILTNSTKIAKTARKYVTVLITQLPSHAPTKTPQDYWLICSWHHYTILLIQQTHCIIVKWNPW